MAQTPGLQAVSAKSITPIAVLGVNFNTYTDLKIRSFSFTDYNDSANSLAWDFPGSGSTLTDTVNSHDGTVVGASSTWVSYGASSPTLTGPGSTTDNTSTQATGTALDTVTAFNLITTAGGYSVAQTIDAQTATTLDYTAESGVNDCTPGTPASGIPLEPTISAAGVTAYQVQQEADDGTNPPGVANITLNGETTHDVVQVMIATSNTTDGESVLATSIIAVEDNMQFYAPKAANGMNITWAADGTFTTDANQTETITVAYFSPATGQWGCIALTIDQASVGPVVGDIINNQLSIGIKIGI